MVIKGVSAYGLASSDGLYKNANLLILKDLRLNLKTRIDKLLVLKNLAVSIEEARALVMSGKVVVKEQRVDKSSEVFAADVDIRLKHAPRFVSRSGDKLAKILESLGAQHLIRNSSVLDVGSSTGGFTDCCLQLGASKVVCVDVGTNQLHWKIRQNPRVDAYEQTHINKFVAPSGVKFNLIVVDVSFNSLIRLSEHLLGQPTQPNCLYVLLVKPQFELSSNLVGKNGIVDSLENRELACSLVKQHFDKKLGRQGVTEPSEILGRTGNQEYFLVYM